jgi:hypothetical protein
LHAGTVLDGAGYPGRDVELRGDGLAGLADLKLGADRVGEVFILAGPRPLGNSIESMDLGSRMSDLTRHSSAAPVSAAVHQSLKQ